MKTQIQWKLGKSWGCQFSSYLVHIILQVLTRAITQLKINRIQTRKEKVKVSLSVDDVIVYRSNPKNLTRRPL